MEQENKEVNPSEAHSESESSTDEQKQEETVTEDVQKTSSDKGDIASNLKKALEQERAERKKLQERLKSLTGKPQEEEEADPMKAVTKAMGDPFVKENLDLIQEVMEEGNLTISQASERVKVMMFDRIMKESAPQADTNPQKQEKPSAIPEPQKPQLSGNLIKDIISGKVEADPALAAALKRKMQELER